MKKFTEIEQFRHVIANVKRRWSYERKLPVLNYTGTVKLHGCNAGISRVNGKFKCQSRNGLIDVSSDLFGFAKFVEQIDHEKFFSIKFLATRMTLSLYLGNGLAKVFKRLLL